MNWLLFVLALLASAALAASGPSSEKVEGQSNKLECLPAELRLKIIKTLNFKHQSRMRSTDRGNRNLVNLVIGEKTQEEITFLNQFEGRNQEIPIDEEIVAILVRDHKVKEKDARQGVELARKAEQNDFFFHWYGTYLQLKLIPHFLSDAQQLYTDALEKVESEQPEMRLDGVYNDDRKMDFLFMAILIDRQRAGYTLTREQLQHYLQFHVGFHLDVDNANFNMVRAFRIWKIMQKARQTIRDERREGSEHNAPRNVDARMVDLLEPIIGEYADRSEIENIMQQARHANTLELAVIFRKEYALVELVASQIVIPRFTLLEIAQQATQVEIVKILRRHPSFDVKVLSDLMLHIIKTCQKEQRPILNLLLKDELATSEILDRGFKSARRSCQLHVSTFWKCRSRRSAKMVLRPLKKRKNVQLE